MVLKIYGEYRHRAISHENWWAHTQNCMGLGLPGPRPCLPWPARTSSGQYSGQLTKFHPSFTMDKRPDSMGKFQNKEEEGNQGRWEAATARNEGEDKEQETRRCRQRHVRRRPVLPCSHIRTRSLTRSDICLDPTAMAPGRTDSLQGHERRGRARSWLC